MGEAADRWRTALATWALPESIVSQAQESPWIHPPELFAVPDEIPDTPSHRVARDVLDEDATVLDVGCGGGIAALAVCPPARRVFGVDEQPAMLEMFQVGAQRRGVLAEVVQGNWPDVAGRVPAADVVTAHHVVYNVGDIVPFLDALTDHARRRVVLEMPDHHPLSAMSPLWRHFWGLERPQGPTPEDLVDVIAEMGLVARREQWRGPRRDATDPDREAHFMRVRLCLPSTREAEVRAYLEDHPLESVRRLTTLWWDVAP